MGFSGGGGSQTLPHTHDSNIANDGGALQFNNVTQGSMAAGDITYSDGSHLQVLSYPAIPAGESLSAPALSTAPTWAAAGATGSYQFIEKFTLGANSQYFDCTLATPYVYNDYDHLVLQLSLQASVTTNGQGLCCQYANSGTSYHTSNLFTMLTFVGDLTGVVKEYYGGHDCVVLQPSSGTVGDGIDDNHWVTANMSFYNAGSSGAHKNKPFKNWAININKPSGSESFGFHEDATNRTELSSFRFAFCQDDFTFPAGTFEVAQDSTVTAYRVANS